MHTPINTRGFFDSVGTQRRFSHYLPSTKELKVYSLQDPLNPTPLDVHSHVTAGEETQFEGSQDLREVGSGPNT